MLPTQNTPAWLEFRKNKIGASDAPIIMEDSPWSTPYELWKNKMGLSEPRTISAYMERGHDLEEGARNFFEKQTGIAVYPQVILHDTLEWMMASVDGLSIDGKTVVEIKCPGKQDHALAKNGTVPAKYYAQLQHQMAVCNVPSMYYLSYDVWSDNITRRREEEGYIIEVKRDPDYIKDLIQKETDFWNCMQSFNAPDLCDRDFENKDDDIWIETACEWLDINVKIKALEEREQEIRGCLNQLSGGRNCSGGGIRVTKVVRKGSIDYSKIPVLHSVDLEQYRKPPSEFLKISSAAPF